MAVDNNIIKLEFDDGVALEVEIMGVFDVNGLEYIALIHRETKEVYLYRYIVNGTVFELEDIPDADYETVDKAFHAIMEGKA